MVYNDSKTKEKNRKKIVEVTKKTFITKGIIETSIMDIVTSAGMERKTFYNYFKDKKEIASYIYFQTLEKLFPSQFYEWECLECFNYYEKIEKYLLSIAKRYQNNTFDMLYIKLFDNYYNKTEEQDYLKSKRFEINNSFPSQYLIECIQDGSCNNQIANPIDLFVTIVESINTYASNLIFNAYQTKTLDKGISFERIYQLIDIHLRNIKSEVFSNENI